MGKKYLEKAGVLELLTKSLVSLYEEPEKPGNAVNYLKKHVGGTDNDKAEIDKLQVENSDLKTKIAALEADQAKLRARLEELEKNSASGGSDDKDVAMKVTTEAPAAEAETAPEATSEPTKEPEEAAEAVQPTETDASIDNKGPEEAMDAEPTVPVAAEPESSDPAPAEPAPAADPPAADPAPESGDQTSGAQ